MCISTPKEIKAKVLGAHCKPERSRGHKIIRVHFIMEACFVTVDFFEVINDLDEALEVIFFSGRQSSLLVFASLTFIFFFFSSIRIW